jgi:hypothetical protein
MPPTTEAAAPTTEAAVGTTVAEAAALVPEAVCRGVDGEVYFGYTNESTEPVVVEEGDANSLSGAAADDNPLLTTLFAPGTVEVAFWAVPPPDSGDDVVWTLTGPDGVERTATTTEACPQDFPAFSDAEPTLEVVGQTLAADGESADIDLQLVGLDETSVCNEAFTAEPRLVVINEGTALPTAFEPEATVTVGSVLRVGPWRPAGEHPGVRLRPRAVFGRRCHGIVVVTGAPPSQLRDRGVRPPR